MYTIAFVGPSGTGKSHRSLEIAATVGAEAIIDDGLLISKNKLLAGKSAKKESTKIAAVMRALFTDQEHIDSVKAAIEKNNIQRILLLGTSVKMVERIAKQLEILPIDKIITIDEVATQEEMEAARNMRNHEGKHVIPVPVCEIKQDFSGYFLHPLRRFKSAFGKGLKDTQDKSIIRPTFSYMGDFKVSDSVVSGISAYEAESTAGVDSVNSVVVKSVPSGAEIEISLNMKYGINLKNAALEVQEKIIKSIDYHTAVNVVTVKVIVRKIIMA